MDVQDFAQQYEQMSDAELLCLIAERDTLVPEAISALDFEAQKRGLDKKNAARFKKRMDVLSQRHERRPFTDHDAPESERKIRRFVGEQEPQFVPRHRWFADSGGIVDYSLYKFKVWKVFRDRTGCWPVLSICYHFTSWIAVLVIFILSIARVADRHWDNEWRPMLLVGCILIVCVVLRHLGARLIRKLDWKWSQPDNRV